MAIGRYICQPKLLVEDPHKLVLRADQAPQPGAPELLARDTGLVFIPPERVHLFVLGHMLFCKRGQRWASGLSSHGRREGARTAFCYVRMVSGMGSTLWRLPFERSIASAISTIQKKSTTSTRIAGIGLPLKMISNVSESESVGTLKRSIGGLNSTTTASKLPLSAQLHA